MREGDTLTDTQIVDLFFRRSEQAISAAEAQYGPYCLRISMNILGVRQDAEECLSDTWLAAWNRIPPTRPRRLGVFLGAITRTLSIDRWRREHARKRGGGTLTVAIEELDGMLAGGTEPELELDRRELRRLLETFLQGLSRTERQVFLCRYWYLDSIEDIARQSGFTRSKVKSMLLRTRKKLRRYLEEKGVTAP